MPFPKTIINKKTAAKVALSLLLLTGISQQQLVAQEPLKADSIAQSNTDTITKKSNIFQKLINYFDDSNKVKEEKKFDFSVIGGPHFSSDTKLGLGMVASGLYRIDRSDLSVSPSNVSLYGDVTTAGYWVVGIESNTIFPKGKYRIDSDMYFSSFPSKYWGVGYGPARHGDYSKYTKKESMIKIDFLAQVLKNMYIGATVSFQNINATKFDDISLLNGADNNISALGGGFIFSYDSRDFIPNPYSGIYAKIEQSFFPNIVGSGHSFNRTELIFRAYKGLWKGGILAYDLQGIFNTSDVPWSMTASMGGSRGMRGYYRGQYNDKMMAQTQVELRQHVWRRNSVVAWIGAGNIFPKFKDFKWDQTLPTYGVGYRWEFKKRVNVRLDYGVGKGQTGFYFGINEAF